MKSRNSRMNKIDPRLRSRMVTVVALLLMSGISVGASQQPNVILVMTDDQGYGDLSAHGNPVLETPNLDRLHSESIRLTDFHVAPMCTPTRGQLMTGMDAIRNGATNVSSGRTLLRREFRTMPEYFREADYQTGIFGKWHLGDNYPYRPQDRGFSESLWFPSSHISSLPDYWDNDYFDNTYIRNGLRQPYEGYTPDVFFSEAIDWMRGVANQGGRFFCYIPTAAPHWPPFVPNEYRKPSDVAGLTQAQDLLPTLIDLCHLRQPTVPVDGSSLAEVLRNEEAPPEDRMLVINYSRMPIRKNQTATVRRQGAGVLWKRWRLLEDRELYNLENDPMQATDVIRKYPEVAARMRAHLTRWWSGVEKRAHSFEYVSIGAETENPMMLSACEWADVFVDQQRQVRVAEAKNGYWHLEVTSAGTYEFELRRWPREANLPLRAGLPATRVTDGVLPAGKALSISKARIQIGEFIDEAIVSANAQAVLFTARLEPGFKTVQRISGVYPLVRNLRK